LRDKTFCRADAKRPVAAIARRAGAFSALRPRIVGWPRLSFLALLLCLPAVGLSGDIWVLVDTRTHTLEVYDGERVIERYERIAVGRGGIGRDRQKGDMRTPLGRFRVAWFNPHSRFRFFIGLDYPRREHVERAFREGVIDEGDRRRFRQAFYHNRRPPQDTPLGGFIGIHGLGRADPGLHDIADWTEGCVAVTNEQIDRLKGYVEIGTPVIIR